MRNVFCALLVSAVALAGGGFVCAGSPVSDDETLKRIAVDPAEGLQFGYGGSGGDSWPSFEDAPAGCGTVHPKASVVTYIMPSGLTVRMAIDSDDPEAKRADVIRFDFHETGQFNLLDSLPLSEVEEDEFSMGGQFFHATFGSATLEVEHDGETVPYFVSGDYFKWGGAGRYLELTLGTGLEGSCRIGDREYRVRVIDGNSNMNLGDPCRMVEVMPDVDESDDKTVCSPADILTQTQAGDTLIVDTGDGTFTQSVQKSFYDQPVFLGGEWYTVLLNDDKSRFVVEKLNAPTGHVHIPHKNWSAMLVGEKHLVSVGMTDQPIPIPSDRYTILNYEEYGPKSTNGDRAVIQVNHSLYNYADFKMYEVKKDGMTKIKIGSPLIAKATVAGGRQRDSISVSLGLTDASGRDVNDIRLANGQRPKPPKIKIVDGDGKKVDSFNLEYG